MRAFAIAAFIAGLAGAAQAADPVGEPNVSLTIYNNNSNLTLVQDVRELDLAQGRTRLEFKDVSASIQPETVSLTAPGVTVAEQNFDYDLLTPAKMMEKAVGKQIKVIRTGPNGQKVTETATVLSVNDGVILKIGDRIEVLHDGGEPTQVIFDSIPENLRARPTLSVTVDAATAGKRSATLSYLTYGVTWKADYVAVFDEKKGLLDLQGWITLTNNSGTTFRDAETQLVAGNLGQGGPRPGSMTAAGRGGGPQGQQIADYYLYPLPERVTVANAQTKQVGFLDAPAIDAHKTYHINAYGFESQAEPEHAGVTLDFSNQKAGGPALAMPAGVLRVYVRDSAGTPKFIGEDQLGHTPAGSQLAISTGEAFDVTAQATLKADERINDHSTRYTMDYVFRNARAEPVTVDFVQGSIGPVSKMEKESQPGRAVDANSRTWAVPVPANGETHLTFSVVVTGG